MSVFEESKSYKPFKYPWAVQAAQAQENIHWHEQEIIFEDDIRQWNDGTITPKEKELVKEIMKTFTQSDTQVAQGYIENFLPVFKNNEIRQMLISFAAREGIHQRAYALFTDTIGIPEEQYGWFLEVDVLRDRMEKMVDMDMKTIRGRALALARSIISEGVALFGAFTMLLNFQFYHKLPGLCKVNEWSVRDEVQHFLGLTQLFRVVCDEHPRIVNDDFKATIYQMFRDAVMLEDKFVDIAYEKGETPGLKPDEVKAFLRFLSDRHLTRLGLKPNWGIKDVPLKWMVEAIEANNQTNFFEQRVTDYSAVSLSGSWDAKNVLARFR